jgi:Activator of Hsp90 ATPase homolog 1-like protein
MSNRKVHARALNVVTRRQARAGSWNPGAYSIAKFDLVEESSGTKLVFDHTGFPRGAAEELASGWKEHYWEPMQKLLA